MYAGGRSPTITQTHSSMPGLAGNIWQRNTPRTLPTAIPRYDRRTALHHFIDPRYPNDSSNNSFHCNVSSSSDRGIIESCVWERGKCVHSEGDKTRPTKAKTER